TLKIDIVRDALRRIARLDDPPLRPLVELSDSATRTTIRAAIRDGRAGYRSRGSHDVITVDSCLVVHPLIADLLVNSRYGQAREVVLRCGARTGERLAAPTPSAATIDVPEDARRDHIHEEAAGRRWRVSARSFFQPSPEAADALTELVTTAAADMPTGHAVDLYGGVGLFAGALADRGWRTTSVEGSSAAAADARANLDATTCDVVRADVVEWDPLAADLVVADPSRAGLKREGVAVIEATGTTRAVLVSCDAAALGRDTRLLLDAGYRLTAVTPVDLFPHSFHIEAVSVFDR
ncbi:MAG TPA: hypothetical protein VFB78_01520, partial [Acidimicrobiales bacterium]|nr:hypothetical protein [Acidimicrobiales bacterium]